MAVYEDPAGLYGADPDYEDWASSGMGKKLNMGFVYENKLYSQYKQIGMVPVGFSPAGADSTAADLELWVPKYNSATVRQPREGAKLKIEVKLDPNADYGQASLTHNGSSWRLSGKDTPEALEMRRLLNSMNVVTQINRVWPGQPNLFNYSNSKQVPEAEKTADLETYKSSYISGDGFARAFSTYYSSKGVNYIQIGGYGLYYLNRDPNGLRHLGATKFLSSGASMKLRIRTKGSASQGTYRFSTALLMDKFPRASGFDLDNEADQERIHWDGVSCRNAPSPLSRQRGLLG
tara:strand:- start:110 stop:982 length:873 start_codon:yes stop_codon:yes gene_type:complete